MPERNLIVVGASSGGVEALVQLVRGLPADFPGTVLVVCHIPGGAKSVLPEILSKAGRLPAVHARDGVRFELGHIYIAPPDRHLLVDPNRVLKLTRDARENHHRPAVDPLFRSAARHYGAGVIGVILTGSLYDGTAGLMAVRASGGLAVIQDPKDAVVAAMPQNAVDIAGADYIVPIAGLAELIVKLVDDPVSREVGGQAVDPIDKMPEIVARDMSEQALNHRQGQVSVFTCPECGGSLWQVEHCVPRFRCHVGHVYLGETLLADQTVALEAALWTAVRGFREKAVLSRQLEAREEEKGNSEAAARFREQAEQAARYGNLILRHVLLVDPNGEPGPPTAPVQDSTP